MARALLAVVALTLGLAVLTPAHAVVPPIKQPAWVELSIEQREILAPLASEWDQLEHSRRKKWLGIVDRYPAMKAEEQARIQRRMAEWVKLSPEDRKLAREKFKNLQKAPPEHKETVKQKWQEYKELPEEEKQRLQAEAAAKAATKPKVAVPPRAPGAPTSQKPPALPVPALQAAQPPSAPVQAAPAAPATPASPAPASSAGQ
ncbi:MAG: DUF3106 domain-containing protein [Ignavibacteria bacterium]